MDHYKSGIGKKNNDINYVLNFLRGSTCTVEDVEIEDKYISNDLEDLYGYCWNLVNMATMMELAEVEPGF